MEGFARPPCFLCSRSDTARDAKNSYYRGGKGEGEREGNERRDNCMSAATVGISVRGEGDRTTNNGAAHPYVTRSVFTNE